MNISDEAPIWHDSIAHIPTGDAVTDAIYNMERASRDYSLPIHRTIGTGK